MQFLHTLLLLAMMFNFQGRATTLEKFDDFKIVSHVEKRQLEFESKPHCSISGDPHIVTADGMKFSFQGTCTYKAFTTRCPDGRGPLILAKFQTLRPGVSAVTEVSIQTTSGRVIIRDDGSMRVNGKKWNRNSFTSKGGYGMYDETTEKFLVERYNQFAVTFEIRRHRLTIYILHNDANNKLCGLCGNFNNDPSDDLDGMAVDDYGNSQLFSCDT